MHDLQPLMCSNSRWRDKSTINPCFSSFQGLDKPINDLSRGCSVEDILNTVAITAAQAE